MTGVTRGSYSAPETDPVFLQSKSILDALRQLQVDQKDPTGFVDGANITMSYSAAGRTITLTHSSGFVDYYWKGEKKQLASPWTSSAHAVDATAKFLMSADGTTFVWSDTPWQFDYIFVAFVAASRAFAVREVHGIWPYSLHSAWHYLFGTYRKSGGGLVAGTFALNTDTDAANNPSFASCVVTDEDLDSTIALWPENTYTHLWFTGSGTANFDATKSNVVHAAGGFAFVNTWSGGTFAWAATANNRYINYYVIRIPVTSDVESQKYRAVVLQPQVAYTSLAAAQAETPNSLQLGELANLATEFIEVERITYLTASGNTSTGQVQMVQHVILTGTKVSQAAISGVTPTTAENVSFVPAGALSSVNVQAALEELAAYLYVSYNEQSGNVYTLVLTDASKDILFTSADTVCCIVPANTDVPFPIGTVISIEQAGAGLVVVNPYDVTVTIDAYLDGRQSMGQYATMQLKKKDTNTWTLIGGDTVTETCPTTTEEVTTTETP